MQLAGIKKHSMVNGPGVRCVVFFQGCPHHCDECQNPETWDLKKGKEVEIESLLHELKSIRYLDGFTFSGGDPFFQPQALEALTKALKEDGQNIWVYTGYSMETLMEKFPNVLPYIDVVVDGRYDKTKESALWRGSSNQRLVDVPKSLKSKKVICLD